MTGGHLIPLNDLGGRPRKPCELTIIIIIIIMIMMMMMMTMNIGEKR